MRSAPLVLLIALAGVFSAAAVQLAVYRTIADIWSDVALQAAEATVSAVQKQTGLPYSLREVPLETFGVYVGRQHHLTIELDGRQYELLLHDDRYNQQQHDEPVYHRRSLPPASSAQVPAAGAAAAAAAAGAGAASKPSPHPPGAAGGAQQELPFDPFSWQRQRIQLPEVTLAGPVELVLQRPTPLTLFLPHVTDAPPTQRLLVGPGVMLTLQQLRGISLRKPVDLPHLPPAFVAQVFAQHQLGGTEPGFDHAPGMLYLANELYRAATNASLGVSGASRFLLSFEVEPAGPAMTLLSAALPGASQPQQLRVKKLSPGTLEVTLRHADDQEAALAVAAAAAAPGGLSPGALAPIPWAWPLPTTPMSDWVTYESFLRGLISNQPLHKGLQQGLALRLKRSSVKGISLIKFEMQLRGGGAPALPGVERLVPAEAASPGDQGSLEVWEALVQVKEKADGTAGVEYVPLSTKRKHAYHSTLSFTSGGMALLAGLGNASFPGGMQ